MKKVIAIFAFILVFVPVIALAQAQTSNPCALQTGSTVQASPDQLPKCVNQIYVWSLGLAVLLALLMIIVGGYHIMTAGGNAEQSTKGKEYITSALIGVVILFCAYLLLHQINPDLVNFNINSLNGLNGSSTQQNQTSNPASGAGIRESDCHGTLVTNVDGSTTCQQ